MTSLVHLSLTHFRNYQHLELDFSSRLTLLRGDNAQGKTNLLEAIYLLSTSKPVHAQTEREVVDWQAEEEPIPYCRVAAQVMSHQKSETRLLELEIVYVPRSDGVNFSKQVKINGVNKRSMDLVGLLRSVLFLPEDVALVAGAPSERRRYLDIALCQIDPGYCRALSAYQKVVTQRNSLLKTLRDQGVQATSSAVDAQLGFWDEKLIQHGAAVLAKRQSYVIELDSLARLRHADLTAGREALCVEYVPTFNFGPMDEDEFRCWKAGEMNGGRNHVPAHSVDAQTITGLYEMKLHRRRSRELAAGATLYGPHRDDLRFLADGRDLRTYGSRGQQRSAALSLKLAEVQAMMKATGSSPLLLLDDVMSELDAKRRGTLLEALGEVDQAVLTTTDWDDFSPEFRAAAQCLRVETGQITAVSGVQAEG